MLSQEVPTVMEHDQTIVPKEELEYWKKQFPSLDETEIVEILECIQIEDVKENFWKENPTLPEEAVDKVVAENAASSYEYHLYNDLNNEAT